MEVYLIAKSQPIYHTISQWLSKHHVDYKPTTTHSTEAIAEYAGRVCYDSFANPRPGGTQAYLQNILKQGHGSVLEHCVYTFAFVGLSRVCTHELVRHRAGFSYSQRSQRYCDEGCMNVVDPLQGIEIGDKLREEIRECIDKSRELYDKICSLLEREGYQRKVVRSVARYFLPQGISTEIVVTANARSWRHFLETRGSRHADREIRLLANKVLDKLLEDSPNLFGDYKREPLGDGTCEITTEWEKV